MQNNSKSFVTLGLSSGGSLFFSVLRTKVVATYMGPAGTGIFALLNSIVQYSGVVANVGQENILTRQVSKARSQSETYKVLLIYSAVSLNLCLTLCIAIFLFFSKSQIEQVFSGQIEDFDLVIAIISGGMLSVSMSLLGVLSGEKKFKAIAVIQLTNSLISFISMYFLVHYNVEDSIILALLATYASNALVSVFVVSNVIRFKRKYFKLFSTSIKLSRRGIPLVMAAVATLTTHLVIRMDILEKLGVQQLGIQQAAFILSATYLTVIFSSLSKIYYPNLVQNINLPEKFSETIQANLIFCSKLALPFLTIFFVFSLEIVSVLYSPEFKDSSVLLQMYVFADAIKVLSWTLGFVILAHGNFKLHLVFELFINTVFIGAYFLFFNTYGIVSAPLSIIVGNFVYVVTIYLTLKYFYRVKIKLIWARYLMLFFAFVLVSHLFNSPPILNYAFVTFSLILASRAMFKR